MQRCIRREAQLGAAASERQSQDPVDDLQRLRVRRLGVRQIRAEISVEVQDGIEIAPKQPQLVLELCLREREQHQHLRDVNRREEGVKRSIAAVGRGEGQTRLHVRGGADAAA
eukprot:358646-Pleurochrysis_carterae.AAC.1